MTQKTYPISKYLFSGAVTFLLYYLTIVAEKLEQYSLDLKEHLHRIKSMGFSADKGAKRYLYEDLFPLRIQHHFHASRSTEEILSRGLTLAQFTKHTNCMSGKMMMTAFLVNVVKSACGIYLSTGMLNAISDDGRFQTVVFLFGVSSAILGIFSLHILYRLNKVRFSSPFLCSNYLSETLLGWARLL